MKRKTNQLQHLFLFLDPAAFFSHSCLAAKVVEKSLKTLFEARGCCELICELTVNSLGYQSPEANGLLIHSSAVMAEKCTEA